MRVPSTIIVAAFLLIASTTARAIMAGAAPDTPAARIDPNTSTTPWTGVGAVVVGSQSFSGVLVSPRHVLTAAHVVGSAPATSVQFVLNIAGDQTHLLPAQRISVYPTASFPYDDLALIELGVPAPAQARWYPLLRTPLSAQQRVTLVGYGSSGQGDVGVTVGGVRTIKRIGQNVVDAVQTTLDTSGRTSWFYLYDFDGPVGNGQMGGATLGNAIETVVAGSDSGSPAFVVAGSSIQLLGINSFVTPSAPGGATDYRFGTVGGGILLNHQNFLSWIDEAIAPPAVDIPTLSEWASIAGIALFGFLLYRQTPRGLRHV